LLSPSVEGEHGRCDEDDRRELLAEAHVWTVPGENTKAWVGVSYPATPLIYDSRRKKVRGYAYRKYAVNGLLLPNRPPNGCLACVRQYEAYYRREGDRCTRRGLRCWRQSDSQRADHSTNVQPRYGTRCLSPGVGEPVESVLCSGINYIRDK
jgi:hypothetical protein